LNSQPDIGRRIRTRRIGLPNLRTWKNRDKNCNAEIGWRNSYGGEESATEFVASRNRRRNSYPDEQSTVDRAASDADAVDESDVH